MAQMKSHDKGMATKLAPKMEAKLIGQFAN